MTLYDLYKKIISVGYIEIAEETASYYADIRGDTLYLYFEGSNGGTDWKNNLDFPAKAYHEMRDTWFVHRGFLRVWKVIRERIKSKIMSPSVRRIIIGGYSHGAAVALLCHEYCVFNRIDIADNIWGYGFGCPRVIWGFLKDSIQYRFKHFYVIRNSNDLVTHLPPILFGFRHAPNIIRIGSTGKYSCLSAHYQDSYLRELEKTKINVGEENAAFNL